MNTAPVQVAAKCHQPASPHFWSANGCSTPLVGPLRAVPPPWSAPSGLFHPPGQPKAVPPQGRPKAVPPQGQPKAVPPQGRPTAVPPPRQPKAVPPPGQPTAVPPPWSAPSRLFHPPRSATAVPPYLLHRLLHRQPAQVAATPQSSTSQSVLAVTACMHAPVWLQE